MSGRQVDDLDYYLILAKWKLGVVLEQGYIRANAADGSISPDQMEKMQMFGPIVLDTVQAAADLAESTDYGRR